MIKTWNHKGLKLFFESGSTSGIQSKHSTRLRLQLGVLNAAIKPEDMNLPGWKFHELKGGKKGYFAVTVNRNWRLTFKFEDHDAILVNYEDYH
jgi:proteic killer suppression protein